MRKAHLAIIMLSAFSNSISGGSALADGETLVIPAYELAQPLIIGLHINAGGSFEGVNGVVDKIVSLENSSPCFDPGPTRNEFEQRRYIESVRERVRRLSQMAKDNRYEKYVIESLKFRLPSAEPDTELLNLGRCLNNTLGRPQFSAYDFEMKQYTVTIKRIVSTVNPMPIVAVAVVEDNELKEDGNFFFTVGYRPPSIELPMPSDSKAESFLGLFESGEMLFQYTCEFNVNRHQYKEDWNLPIYLPCVLKTLTFERSSGVVVYKLELIDGDWVVYENI